MAIDSHSGAEVDAGGIPREETLAAAGKTLARAARLPEDVVELRIQGKVIDAALLG